jgi:hypothetical protein
MSLLFFSGTAGALFVASVEDMRSPASVFRQYDPAPEMDGEVSRNKYCGGFNTRSDKKECGDLPPLN